MKVKPTKIEGLIVIEPNVFYDERGYFSESYKKSNYEKAGITNQFVQDNLSKSEKGVLRGLHYQAPPYAQDKLIQVIQGSVLDVVVDIRTNSKTYGQHFAIELNAENKLQLLVPKGFAHGFLTLEDNTIFSYKCSNEYNKESEGSVLWSDTELGIDWGIENPIVSKKDNESPSFDQLVSPF
jgi:dTDP-4-dehydrorhamnose 3,5-epimerase